MRAPRLSILLPLQDEREAGVDCVRAWADGQSADRDDYEIVAVAIGDDASLERSVRPLLREQDAWIDAPGIDEYEAFNAAAEASRGRFVFLTEAHCVPDRDCVAATLEELERSGAPGVRIRSVPVHRGPFGALEMEAVSPALRMEVEDPDHWRRILIHGTAIRRDVYFDLGGVPARFGDFAPWAMSMRMEDGQRPALSTRPRVAHVYDGDFRKIDAFIRSFAAGEVRYRSEHPGETTDQRLPWSAEWERQLEHTRLGAVRALRNALALRRGTPGSLLRHSVVAFLGPRAPIVKARTRAAIAKARARLARDANRRSSSFQAYWLLTARLGRLQGLAHGDRIEPGVPAAATRIDLTEPLAGRVIGFYQAEHPGGEPPFRWTAPLALMRVNVRGEGRRLARLELRPSEWAEDAWIRVAVDGQVVPARVRADAVEFEVVGGERWIAIGSKPTRPGKGGADDRRVLGLPVRALSFESM